jgi:threonine dehydratase
LQLPERHHGEWLRLRHECAECHQAIGGGGLLIAEKSRTIAEGAGALSLAAALSGQQLDGPIVCVVSGGNIDLDTFAELVAG